MSTTTFGDFARAGYQGAIHSSLGLAGARNGILTGLAIGAGLAGMAACIEKIAPQPQQAERPTLFRRLGTTSIKGIQDATRIAAYTTASVTLFLSSHRLNHVVAEQNSPFSELAPYFNAATKLSSLTPTAAIVHSIVGSANIVQAMTDARGQGHVAVGRAAMQAVGFSALKQAARNAFVGAVAGICFLGCKTVALQLITKK